MKIKCHVRCSDDADKLFSELEQRGYATSRFSPIDSAISAAYKRDRRRWAFLYYTTTIMAVNLACNDIQFDDDDKDDLVVWFTDCPSFDSIGDECDQLLDEAILSSEEYDSLSTLIWTFRYVANNSTVVTSVTVCTGTSTTTTVTRERSMRQTISVNLDGGGCDRLLQIVGDIISYER